MNRLRRTLGRVFVLSGLAGALLSAAAAAQDAPFPRKTTIELTVLFPAGSSADVTARLLAEGMSKELKANVIVVNRPGAGGAIGYRYVAAQKPDGYNLVWNSNSISTTYYSGELPFDYHAFDTVARVLVESPLLVVRADSPWKNLQGFLDDAKSRPGRITVGNSGAGSHTHICSALLFHAAGVQVIDVPFAAAQVVPSLIGGHVDALLQLPAALSTYIASGQFRALAVITSRRDPMLPAVPTAVEQGVNASLEAWRGVAVPKGTPQSVIDILQQAIQRTVEDSGFVAASERLGVRPAFLPAVQFARLIAKEDSELNELMRLIGLNKQAPPAVRP